MKKLTIGALSGELTHSSVFEYGFLEHLRFLRLRSGIVPLEGNILGVSGYFMSELLLAKQYTPDLTIHINSPGGYVSEAMAIYDLIRGVSTKEHPVRTLTYGVSASAACMIVLQAGHERLSLPNTVFMLHELSGGDAGYKTTSQRTDEARQMKRVQRQALSILAQRTGKSVETITKLIGRKEHWMSAPEAKEWGLIDEVVTTW